MTQPQPRIGDIVLYGHVARHTEPFGGITRISDARSSVVQTIPEPKVLERNLDDEQVMPAMVYEVCSWRDGPANSSVPVSEVHLLIPLPIEGARVALRIKSARALDELVGVLLRYRKEVWPGK